MSDTAPETSATAAVPPADGPPRWTFTLAITNPAGQTVTYTATTGGQPGVDWNRPSRSDPDAPALTLDAPTLLALDRTFDLAGLPADAAEQMYPQLRPGGPGRADTE
jgi:hypothetical protein